MPHPALTAIVSRIRRVAQPAEARSDGELLTAFLAAGEANAFAELVARFGPMVFAVCRRVTGHHQDAEDAFQATFVILARKAASIVPREAVGNWLYGVAVRTAREARTMAAKRLAREVPVAHLPDVARPEPEPNDLDAVLHEELAELPDKFRTLLVLCDLRGERQTEVAGRLGLPVGTVYSRLAKARSLLAERLRKRGVALSVVGLAAALTQAGQAAVPAGLSPKAVAAALSPDCVPAAVAALTNGVFRTMFLHKLTLGVACGLVLAVAGFVAASAFTDSPAKEAAKPPAAKPAGPGAILLVRKDPYHLLTPEGKKLSEFFAPKLDSGADTAGGRIACLSPDGTQAASFVLPGRDELRVLGHGGKPWPFKIVIQKVEKPDSEQLWDMPAMWLNLCWTADGKKLVVVKYTDPGRDKGIENLLFDPTTGKTEPLALPDGVRVLDCGRDGKTFLVEVIDPKVKKRKLGLVTKRDAKVRELTELQNKPSSSTTGRLSPDGTKVLFTDADPERKHAYKWGMSHRPYLLDVKTGKREPLADFPDNGKVCGIAWSPDGKRVAYTWMQVHDELLKKETIDGEDMKIGSEAFLIVADANGKNAKTIASEKGQSALHMIFGMIDWRYKLGEPAPAPKPPPPKKLARVADPSPELQMQLYKFDAEYRHAGEEKFAELEKLADDLAKRFPNNDDQARIWHEVVHVAAQSGIAKHADRVRKYAHKCLAISRDPLHRGRIYSTLACTVDLRGTAFPKGRLEAAEILLTGYVEMLAQELPETAPELPAVNVFDFQGDPIAEAQARARHAAQMAARREAEFTRDLVGRRDTLVMQLRDLFKPQPNYHGRNPEGPNELRALARKKMSEQQVKVLMEKVTK